MSHGDVAAEAPMHGLHGLRVPRWRLPDGWHKGWTWAFRRRVYEVTFTQYRTAK